MVDAATPPEHPPAFQTVLAISGDPEAFKAQGVDPVTQVKYFGPMYFDLDGEGEIDEVLGASREIVTSLQKVHGIPAEAIKAYLSGKKGVHLLVHPGVFGVKGPKLLLPLVWQKFALKFDSKYVDRSVYSMGKGRIWRCCNIKRPDVGTYKVEVSLGELEKLTAAGYAEAVKTPREETAWPERVAEIPALVSFVEAAAVAVRKELKARKRAADGVSVADLRSVPGTPGCIEKLVTIGDCADSNWNQAAMQLAGYIAGRYDRNEDEAEINALVGRFIDNVTSSSRPGKSDREREMQAQLDRAFSGATKFSAGGIIATLGEACGNCVVCAKDRVLAKALGDGDGAHLDEATAIRLTHDGVYLVGKDSARMLLNCGITQTMSFVEYDKRLRQEKVLSGAYTLEGGEVDSPFHVEIDEALFTDKRRFSLELAGSGAVFEGNDNDLQRLYRTLYRQRKGIEKMIRTIHSGIVFHETDDGIFPSLVTKDESYRKGQLPSEYIYSGPPNLAPTFSKVRDFESREDMRGLAKTLRALFSMNEPHIMYPAIGWTCAAHLKTHLTHVDKSYPMLNLCGVSETGKSNTAFLLLTLNAFPYRGAPSWNAETDTIYPLEEMVTTSTTIIRLVEEANETNAKKNWHKLCGILKNSWDQIGISKGTIKGRSVVTERKPNPAPVMYLSEQPFPIQSVRTRSIECLLTSKAVEDPFYSTNFAIALDGAKYLEMFAKVLANTALNTTMAQVKEWRQRATDLLPSDFTGRTRTAYEVVMVGLIFLSYVAQFYDKGLSAFVDATLNDFARMLESGKADTMSGKRVSAVSEMLMTLDQMAMEHDNVAHGLKAGTHYWRTDGSIYLDARSVFPRFQRYMRGVGREAQVSSYMQMMKLLRGEPYCKGTITNPENAATQLVHLDVPAMAVRGIEFPHFQEQVLA